jgi:ABC-type multidrug transport system fused ATPase/permease subunit
VTSIVVSHRATLIKDCDEIWLFDAGRLVSRGSHEELKRSSDLYQRMLDSDHAGTPEAA